VKSAKGKVKSRSDSTEGESNDLERRRKSAAELDDPEDPMPMTPSKGATAAATGGGGQSSGPPGGKKVARRGSTKITDSTKHTDGAGQAASSGQNGSKVFKASAKKSLSAAAPSPVSSPAPIQPPSRPDVTSQKAARKVREEARGEGDSTADA